MAFNISKLWKNSPVTLIKTANSVGLINCLLQPSLFYLRILKSIRVEINSLIKSCVTRTDPAAETKSIGLQADARVVMVFAVPPRLFYRDKEILPTYRDHAIWTVLSWQIDPTHLPGLCPPSLKLRRSKQKRMPTLTQTATHQTAGPLGNIVQYAHRQI